MPCFDGYPPTYVSDQAQKRADLNARVACNALTTLDKVLSQINAKPCQALGLTQETLDWWADHKQRDAARLAREEEARQHEQLKAQALAKLSVEERKALNL